MTPDVTNASRLSPTTVRVPYLTVKSFSILLKILFSTFTAYTGWFFSRWTFHLLYFWFVPGIHHSDLDFLGVNLFLIAGWLLFLTGILISSVILLSSKVLSLDGSFLVSIFIILSLLHIHLCIIEPVRVSGPSMQPALHSGEMVWVEKWTGGIRIPFPELGPGLLRTIRLERLSIRSFERGDIVAIRYPGLDADNQNYILKRIAGLPGDPYSLEKERIVVAGREFPLKTPNATPEEFIAYRAPVHTIPQETKKLGDSALYAAQFGLGPAGIVPEGSVLVLGDNPVQSRDSRSFGFVPFSFLVGRVLSGDM